MSDVNCKDSVTNLENNHRNCKKISSMLFEVKVGNFVNFFRPVWVTECMYVICRCGLVLDVIRVHRK